jgi:hypothetical protein
LHSYTYRNVTKYNSKIFKRYVAYLARSDAGGFLNLSTTRTCLKTVTCIDLFGTGDVISNIVVQELWRKGLHAYRCSDTGYIALKVGLEIYFQFKFAGKLKTFCQILKFDNFLGVERDC